MYIQKRLTHTDVRLPLFVLLLSIFQILLKEPIENINATGNIIPDSVLLTRKLLVSKHLAAGSLQGLCHGTRARNRNGRVGRAMERLDR